MRGGAGSLRFVAVFGGSSLARRIHSGPTRKGRVWTAPRQATSHGFTRAGSLGNMSALTLQGLEIPASVTDLARADSDNLDCGQE